MFKQLSLFFSRGFIDYSALQKHTKTRSTFTMASKNSSWPSTAKENLVWIDLEMTGLDVEKHHIMEIACLITDSSLNIAVEGPDIVIHQPENVLASMNEWCVSHHGESGLTEASRNSKISVQKAEQAIVNFLKLHIPPGKCPLAGNSVYMDRVFLQRHMPEIDKYLHYRIVDVSTIKELCKRWNPQTYSQVPCKILCHRALSDIKESVKELQYYQSYFFKIKQ